MESTPCAKGLGPGDVAPGGGTRHGILKKVAITRVAGNQQTENKLRSQPLAPQVLRVLARLEK